MIKQFLTKSILIFCLFSVTFVCFPLEVQALGSVDLQQRFGMNVHLYLHARFMKEKLNRSNSEILTELTSMHTSFKEADLKWAREELDWAQIEAIRGAWDYSLSDMSINLYESGENITGILKTTPLWASGVSNSELYKPLDVNNWRVYVRNVVNRYKGKIKYWEIWNEADIPEGFYPKVGETKEKSYLDLIKAAYEEIKLIDPNLKVLSNSFVAWYVSGSNIAPKVADNWVKYFMQNGGPYFDIFNIHSYAKTTEELRSDVTRSKQLLINNGLNNTPIWVTENNIAKYFSGEGSTIPGGNSVENVGNNMQWWVKEQLYYGAEKVFWFTLLNWQCDPGCNNYSHAGLLKYSDRSKQKTFYTTKAMMYSINNIKKSDINSDNIVDLKDFFRVKQEKGSINCKSSSDIDNNCEIDISDILILKNNFGQIP